MDQRRSEKRTRSEVAAYLTGNRQILARISRSFSLFFCFIPSSFMTSFSYLSLHLHLRYLL